MFEIYKKGQGVVARWLAAGSLGAMAAFGCYELRNAVNAREQWADTRWLTLDVGVYVAGFAFVLAALGVGWIVNLPRFVDYLIASEIELRKVSWPTKPELKRQTTVVIFVLFFFALLLWIADLICGLGSQIVFGIGS